MTDFKFRIIIISIIIGNLNKDIMNESNMIAIKAGGVDSLPQTSLNNTHIHIKHLMTEKYETKNGSHDLLVSYLQCCRSRGNPTVAILRLG